MCLAVWGTMASQSSRQKLAIFWPISTFVALGFEYSIEHVLIPHGMLCGAQMSVAMMLNNIIPVTLGNVFAAAVFVAGLHFYAYGRK